MGRSTIDPAKKKMPVSYKLTPWIVKWMRGQDKPAAQLIETALIKTYKLKEPKND